MSKIYHVIARQHWGNETAAHCHLERQALPLCFIYQTFFKTCLKYTSVLRYYIQGDFPSNCRCQCNNSTDSTFFLEEIKAMFSNAIYAFNKHVPKLTCIKFTYKVVICNFNRFTARGSRGHPSYSREVLKFFWNLATFSLELSLTSTKIASRF